MSDYSSTYPTQSPTFAFDAKAGKLDSRLSYSRSSGGTYMSNEKALNSENLLTYSNPNDTAWTDDDVTLDVNQVASPDGSVNASSVTENSANADHRILLSTPINSGVSLTVVAYVKANGRTIVQLGQTGIYSASSWVEFDLSGSGTATTRGGSPTNVSIAQIGSTGWYKISYSSTTTSSGTHYTQLKLCDAANSTVYTGDGSSGVYVYGFNLSTTGQLVTDATSSQRHREYSPLLKEASADSPRFEFAADGQSAAGSPLGLLIEAQATNLQTYSSDFTSWSGQNRVTTTSNVAIAPNGLLEADIVIANTSSTQSHNLSNTSTLASGTTYTASVYAKDAGQRYIQLSGSTGAFGSFQYATFDLQTGSVDTTGVTASAVSVGNGYYRIQATVTATASVTGGVSIGLANSATASRLPLFAGNEYDGIILFGYQLEVGAASSLISTSGSTATRSADSCSVVDATLFSSGEHTIIWEGDTDYAPNDKRFFALSDGSMTNRFVADHDNGTATRLRNWADGVKNVDKSTGVVDMLVGSHKLAATVKTNESQLVVDGTRRQVDTSCVVGGGMNQLAINSTTTGAGSTYNMNGHCKRITYFNVALSQTEAEALTANP